MSNMKSLVLQSFKRLHKTRMKVFAGDQKALTAARVKINEEYRKNKNVTNANAIQAMIKFGEDVEKELRTQIIQACEVKPGVYEAKIREETVKMDNIPFNDAAVLEDGTIAKKCCQDRATNNNK